MKNEKGCIQGSCHKANKHKHPRGFEQLVMRYLDGKASPAEGKKLNSWLSTSEECRKFFAEATLTEIQLYQIGLEHRAKQPGGLPPSERRPRTKAELWEYIQQKLKAGKAPESPASGPPSL